MRGADVVLRGGAPRTFDAQGKLLVQFSLDVRTAILRAPAEPDDFLEADVDVAVPRNGRGGIRRVMRLVGAGWQVHGAREPAQPVGFAARVYGAQIPHDRPGARIENPGSGRPRRLLVFLPMLVVSAAQPVRPRLGTDGGHLEVLRRREDEGAYSKLPRSEVLNVH